MKIAVCDDEEAQRRMILKYLREWSEDKGEAVSAVAFPSAESFLFSWEDDREYDLLILDIEMGGISGMELAEKVRREDEEIPILFVTGYETYMAQGYEVAAIQYLLKPMYREKLFAVLDKVARGRRAEEKLAFQTEEGALLLPPSKIWYAEAAGHYCMLHTADAVWRVRHSITELVKRLGERREFVHCHRSFLVNMKHISAITRSEVVMDDDTRLPVSRGAQKAVNQAFIQNYGLNGQDKGGKYDF